MEIELKPTKEYPKVRLGCIDIGNRDKEFVVYLLINLTRFLILCVWIAIFCSIKENDVSNFNKHSEQCRYCLYAICQEAKKVDISDIKQLDWSGCFKIDSSKACERFGINVGDTSDLISNTVFWILPKNCNTYGYCIIALCAFYILYMIFDLYNNTKLSPRYLYLNAIISVCCFYVLLRLYQFHLSSKYDGNQNLYKPVSSDCYISGFSTVWMHISDIFFGIWIAIFILSPIQCCCVCFIGKFGEKIRAINTTLESIFWVLVQIMTLLSLVMYVCELVYLEKKTHVIVFIILCIIMSTVLLDIFFCKNFRKAVMDAFSLCFLRFRTKQDGYDRFN